MPVEPVLPDPPPGWKDLLVALRELIIVVGATVAAVSASMAQCQGEKTSKEVQVVTQKVDAAAETAVAVKEKLIERTAVTNVMDAKLDKIEAAVKGKEK